MIALSGMFPTFGHAWHAPTERLVRARESCDQSKSQSAFSVHGQGENALVHLAGAFVHGYTAGCKLDGWRGWFPEVRVAVLR
jgi:hypothetical protein